MHAAPIVATLATLAAITLALTDDDARTTASDTLDELLDMTTDITPRLLEHPNVRAFLRMIRWAEGTADADGYRRIVGGQLMAGFADHPGVLVTLRDKTGAAILDKRTGQPLKSTAAGAYQIILRTWREAKAALQLADFTPPSQDLAALFLIRRRGALRDVLEGRIADAIRKCGNEWASLPANNYGQPQKTASALLARYTNEGGTHA